MNFAARIVGDAKIIAHLHKKSALVQPAIAGVVKMHGQMLEAKIKANASGRPGPNAPTGDYRRSWTTRFESSATEARSITGTNKPQALRLEFGFSGIDSLGRRYDQPPFPHVGPARDAIGPQFVAAARRIVRGI